MAAASRPRSSLLVTLALLSALGACGAGGGPSDAPGGAPPAGPEVTPEATSEVTPTTTPGQEWTVVPEVPLGWSVERAARRLARAGLAAERPDVRWPHYAVGTEPAAGTRVPVGSRVRILPGDG